MPSWREDFGTCERFTVSFVPYLYLTLPSHAMPFCSSMYAEVRNPVTETELLLQRGAEVLWFVSGGTLLVLSESWDSWGMCPLYHVSCILNVGWFFSPRFFTHLGLPLPNTVTFCELYCPWGILASYTKHPCPEGRDQWLRLQPGVECVLGSWISASFWVIFLSWIRTV